MNIELTTSQEEKLKKQAQEEILDDIQKQKTFKYFLYRIISGLLLISVFALIVMLPEIMANRGRFLCWTKNDEFGIDSKTGVELVRQQNVDCERFIVK